MRRLILSMLVCFTLVGSALGADILSENEGISPNLDEITSIEIVDEVTCDMTISGTVGAWGSGVSFTCTGSGTAPTAGEACKKALAAVSDCVDKVKDLL